ncbi:MAG: glycerophosphodiester phosphodiesterase [Acidimicrobiales bacterium]|nr:glycerophosphodiester phosphodiesterase [Acidimicrobiales bacterium]
MSTSTPILFAHRGGRAHAPENSMEAFRLAVRLGATGLESDVWCTADGVPVLDHDGRVGRWPRRRAISTITLGEVPATMPTLAALLADVDSGLAVSLDVKDPAAATPVIQLAAVDETTGRLWLCHPDHEVVASWRDLDPRVHLIHSTRVDRIGSSLERHAMELASAGIDGVNLPEAEWSAGLVKLFRRFDLACLGWDAQHRRQIDRLMALGLDGIYGDHVDRLVDGLAAGCS